MLSKKAKKYLYWTPRVLGIIFPLFVSLFALDVFDGKSPILYQIASFFIHLIPVYFLIPALWIAWRHELAGGITYLVLVLIYMSFTRSIYWIIAGPPIVIGLIFIADHFSGKF